MTADHIVLTVVLVVGALAIVADLTFMAVMLRRMQTSAEENVQALRAGQEHIAELCAEVLRRTRP